MDVQRLFEILRKEAECAICLETVKEPKTLPCLHSFCLLCLNNLALAARRQLQTTVNCPVCQTVVAMPDTFEGLPTSFHLNRLVDILALGDDSTEAKTCKSCAGTNVASFYCFDCHDLFCNACIKVHNQMKISSGHRNVPIQSLRANDFDELICRPVLCAEQYHEKDPLEYYCQECEVCICHKCGLLNHNRHGMVEIQQAAEEQKAPLMEVLEKVKTQIAGCVVKMEKGNELLSKGKEEIKAARVNVTSTVEGLVRALKQQETGILKRLDDIWLALQNAHATQQKHLQVFANQLRSSVEYCEAILGRNIGAEILQANDAVVARCEELLRTEGIEIYKPLHVNFVRNTQSTEHVHYGLGQVVVSETDFSQCAAEGKGLQEAKLGEEARFTVKTKDSDGKQFYFEGDQVIVKIQTPTGEDLWKLKVEDCKDGQYTATYTPDSAGQHDVAVMINGQPLTGSPWRVPVIPHQYKILRTFGAYGKNRGQFDGPYDLSVSNRTGNIAVADYRNKRVQIFSADGKYLRSFGQWRTKMGAPDSLAFTRSGDVIVVHSKILSLYTESGNLIKRIISEHLKDPFSVSLAPNDNFIVCDKEDNKIKVLSPDGTTLLQSFSAPDCGSPPWFTVYHQDRFFVSYAEDGCVKVFSKEGKFLYNITSIRTSDKHTNFPVGLAIDKFNNLIVCDYNNGILQVFTLDGTLVASIDEQQSGLLAPYSVAVSNNGHVVAIEISEHCVHVFQ